MAHSSGKKSGSSSNLDKDRSRTGWPDVAIRLIDAFYSLAQSGNLFGVLLFAIFGFIIIVVVRLPGEALENILGGFGAFLASEKFYLLPLLALLVTSVTINIYQEKVYKAHIQDLVEHRKILVHGLEKGELRPLKKHDSAGVDLQKDGNNSERRDL